MIIVTTATASVLALAADALLSILCDFNLPFVSPFAITLGVARLVVAGYHWVTTPKSRRETVLLTVEQYDGMVANVQANIGKLAVRENEKAELSQQLLKNHEKMVALCRCMEELKTQITELREEAQNQDLDIIRRELEVEKKIDVFKQKYEKAVHEKLQLKAALNSFHNSRAQDCLNEE